MVATLHPPGCQHQPHAKFQPAYSSALSRHCPPFLCAGSRCISVSLRSVGQPWVAADSDRVFQPEQTRMHMRLSCMWRLHADSACSWVGLLHAHSCSNNLHLCYVGLCCRDGGVHCHPAKCEALWRMHRPSSALLQPGNSSGCVSAEDQCTCGIGLYGRYCKAASTLSTLCMIPTLLSACAGRRLSQPWRDAGGGRVRWRYAGPGGRYAALRYVALVAL